MTDWMSDAEFKIRTQVQQEFGYEETALITEFIYTTLKEADKRIREDERNSIVERLRELGRGRLEYVFKDYREPKTGDEIQRMGGLQGMIYGEAKGALALARIIGGESDKGWLPSWLWKD